MIARSAVLTVGFATLISVAGMANAAPQGQNFGTHLSGAEEVPPRDTPA